MCGRFVVAASQKDLLDHFALNGHLSGLHAMPPRYNIAPTQPILAIRGDATYRQAHLMRWAFVPDWVRKPADFSLLTNARAESASVKPSFRNALRYRRCIIPASGFYEWQRNGNQKQPYYISSQTGKPLAMAALWETWMGPNGEEQDGVALLTTASNHMMSQIHHRMPVLLDKHNFSCWLDTRSGRTDEIMPLLKAQSEDYLRFHPISKDVNKTTNDYADLLDPVKEQQDDRANKKKASQAPLKNQSGQLDLF
ncbi:MAG: SOS response-associated peptidase [Cohaesibacter sp.]|nr:SOS response-associated peptidase [Cohaesibacter sp.]